MWVSVSPVSVGGDRTSPAPTPALVTGVKLISARIPSSPPQPIPGPPTSAKTAHQLYPRVPGRTFIFSIYEGEFSYKIHLAIFIHCMMKTYY